MFAETDEIAGLCLEGEFDLANAPQIIEEAERLVADEKQLILDLSEATFIDSSVIHALLRVGAEAKPPVALKHLQYLRNSELGVAGCFERIVAGL